MSTNDGIDNETYEAAKPLLKAALEQTMAAGRSLAEWGEFCIVKFGDTLTPYLEHFLKEVHEETIRIEGLTESAREALFGAHVSEQEREARIREAAYYRAERRGFVGGSAEQDWREAEAEVDRQIGEQLGLIEQGCETFTSVVELAQMELDNLRHTVASWFESRPPQGR